MQGLAGTGGGGGEGAGALRFDPFLFCPLVEAFPGSACAWRGGGRAAARGVAVLGSTRTATPASAHAFPLPSVAVRAGFPGGTGGAHRIIFANQTLNQRRAFFPRPFCARSPGAR